MTNSTHEGNTAGSLHSNIAWAKGVVRTAPYPCTRGYAAGWLAGVGCSGYRFNAKHFDRRAYNEGKAEGLAAAIRAR